MQEMINALRNNDYKKSQELGHHQSWKSISYENGEIPEIHPDFGRLVEQSADRQYLLISTHEESFDVTKKVMSGPHPIINHPTYSVENFGKVRIYCEAVARDVNHLFAPITGWDGQEFRWITMPVLSDIQESDGGTPKADPLKNKLKSRDQNWKIHDEEVGNYNGNKLLLDYGMCWYSGNWKTLESQLFD